MKCFIRSNNVALTKTHRREILRQVTKAFSRMQDKVQYVIVSFHDVNGNKGGIDKQCQVKVVGAKPIDVQVFDTKNSLHSALSSALSKARINFVNRAKKLSTKLKSTRRMPAFKPGAALLGAST